MEKKIIETKITICNFDELTEAQQQLINKAKEQVAKAQHQYRLRTKIFAPRGNARVLVGHGGC